MVDISADDSGNPNTNRVEPDPTQTVAEQVTDAYHGIDPNELEGTPNLDNLPEVGESQSSEGTETPPSNVDNSAGDQDWFDNELRERAEIYGMSEDWARKLGTPDAVSGALDYLSKQLIDQAGVPQMVNPMDSQQVEQRQFPQQQQQQPPAPGQTPPQQQPPQQQQGATLDKYEPQLGEYEDGPLAEAIKGMNDHYHEQIAQRDAMLQQIAQQNEFMSSYLIQQEQEMFAERMDTRFDQVSEQYSHLFGAGEMQQLLPNSPEASYRRQVVQQMDTLSRVFAQQGRQVSEERKFKEALGRVLNDLGPAATPHHSNGQSRTPAGTPHGGQFLASPGSANSPNEVLTDQQSFDRKVEQFAADRNLPL